MRTKKEEIIIKLLKEGKTWDQICEEANVSPNTVSRVLDDYEQSEAFKLFQGNHSLVYVRIELSLSPEKVERYYLAYKKLQDLYELSSICSELGPNVRGFLDFYRIAKSFDITPYNMNNALNLGKNIESLKQENSREQAALIENRKANTHEAISLVEFQNQNKNANDHLSKLRVEIELLKSVIDKIKDTPDYRRLKEMISDAVISLSSENYFLLEIALLAVMRTIQEDNTLIPLVLFPIPGELDSTASTQFHQEILTKLLSKAIKFMPAVLDELTRLVGDRVEREIPNMGLLNETDTGIKDQQNRENVHIFQQVTVQSRESVDLANPDPLHKKNGMRENSNPRNSQSDGWYELDDGYWYYT